jgi:hypothetical protein
VHLSSVSLWDRTEREAKNRKPNKKNGAGPEIYVAPTDHSTTPEALSLASSALSLNARFFR